MFHRFSIRQSKGVKHTAHCRKDVVIETKVIKFRKVGRFFLEQSNEIFSF